MKQKGATHLPIKKSIRGTGRSTATSPSLQRLPPRTEAVREIVKCFAATPMLLDIDFSPLEARIYAFLKTRESSQEDL